MDCSLYPTHVTGIKVPNSRRSHCAIFLYNLAIGRQVEAISPAVGRSGNSVLAEGAFHASSLVS